MDLSFVSDFFLELSSKYNKAELDSFLEEKLIYGGYLSCPPLQVSFKKEYLQILSDAYLYKDLIEFRNIKILQDQRF